MKRKSISDGGITYGKSHDEGGIKVYNKSTDQMLEVEGGEAVVNKRAMASDKKFDLDGKEMSVCEVVSEMNQVGGGVKLDCGDVEEGQFLKNGEQTYSEGGLIAPNGNKSNLTPEQYKLVRTPEFKAWFGDWENDPENASKVVDSNGEPLVVYHGTNKDFSVFKIKKNTKDNNRNYVSGMWFFADPIGNSLSQEDREYFYQEGNAKSMAENWVYDEDGSLSKVLECFIRVKNPIEVDGYAAFLHWKDDKDVQKSIKNKKVDGWFIHGSTTDGGVYRDDINVFYPEQIKLADGTNTTFDGNNPDIRYDEGGTIDDLQITLYSVIFDSQNDIQNLYYGSDLSKAKKTYDNINISDFPDGGTAIFEKRTNTYRFIGDLEDGSYELADFPIEDYWEDEEYYKEIDEGEVVEIEHKTLDQINKASDFLLNEVERHYQKIYGNYKYNTIPVGNGFDREDDKYEELGCIQLRITNHSENLQNIDRFGRCDYYISVVIANIDATENRFGEDRRSNEIELKFDSDNDIDEVIIAVTEAIEDGKEYIIRKSQRKGVNKKYHLGGDMSKHLAPNGKPSNLTHEQWHLVRTPEFKAWFGDWEKLELAKIRDSGMDEVTLAKLSEGVSKVVDSNGEPLVCYHGTYRDFTIFDISKVGNIDKGFFSKGFYFTPNSDLAYIYGKNLYACFIDIKNPIRTKSRQDLANDLGLEYDNNTYSEIAREKIISLNYDGVLQEYNLPKGVKALYPFVEIVAYYPEQIKLADGTNTTFDGNNPDIRFENGGGVGDVKFTSYEDAMSWIENESKKYKSKNEFYSTDIYKKTYPKIQKLYQEERKNFGKKGIDIMKSLGLDFGDKVFYDFVSPFGYVEEYTGIIIDKQGTPFVKLDEGQKTISGKTSVMWNKGWRKINTNEIGGEIMNEYSISNILSKTDFDEQNGTNTIFDSSNSDIRFDEGGSVGFVFENLPDDYKEIYQIRAYKIIDGSKFYFSRLTYSEKNVFIIELENGSEIGRATLNEVDNYLFNIRIIEEYRRKGLASSLYDFIEYVVGKKLKPSPDKISNEAKKLWIKRNPDIRFEIGGEVPDEIPEFGYVEEYTGIIIDKQGTPFVKLDEGQKTISGKTSVMWNKGWRKINTNEIGGEIMNEYSISNILSKTDFDEQNGTNTIFDSSNSDIRYKQGGELKKGIATEKEHIKTLEKLYYKEITPTQATEEIAKEHIDEDPNYYSKLMQLKHHKYQCAKGCNHFEMGGQFDSFGSLEGLIQKSIQEREKIKPEQQIIDHTINRGQELLNYDYLPSLRQNLNDEYKAFFDDLKELNLYKLGWRIQFGSSRDWAGLCSQRAIGISGISKTGKNIFLSIQFTKWDNNWKDNADGVIWHEIAHAIVFDFIKTKLAFKFDEFDPMDRETKGHGKSWESICNAISKDSCSMYYRNQNLMENFKFYKYLCNFCGQEKFSNSQNFARLCFKCKKPVIVQKNS